MADLQIHRDHQLGLAAARKVAWAWAEKAEQQFGMECTVIEGDHSDTVEFVRSGVTGRLVVAADHFDLQARLGFLLGAFARTIEREIEKELDVLMAQSGAARAAKAAKAVKPSKAAAPVRKAAKKKA